MQIHVAIETKYTKLILLLCCYIKNVYWFSVLYCTEVQCTGSCCSSNRQKFPVTVLQVLKSSFKYVNKCCEAKFNTYSL